MNMAMEAGMTVFVVDDDASLCDATVNLLESAEIGALPFGSAEEFLEYWKPDMRGCLLLDVRLPGITGVEFQSRLKVERVEIPIIIMTAHGDIAMVRSVMKAGAVDFLTKPFHRQELLAAVEQAFARDRERRQHTEAHESAQSLYKTLTPREREVMALVTAGMLNKQIAAELNLSEITVKLHRRHVMEKMAAGSLAELVKIYERIKPSL